ncbi:hypothetical protein SYNPS1DRAFT_26547 [Syncephalis pseudoplumigaleata]|uniref:Uncharacterized protein n=1 Tax=Syncephalis pseudoplumigaleata TaxID=1712513 RepID=A0A4P9Z5L6_9FUNG|nr:hypothetical protein SYNPS1DRAFT_26547 [Syncephalis pseudoplumigaleata]|eukprot:RKP27815.1 hypothetical protein SYNPS1DRAFT_26547 [Syncephalis pseudoplumigaleata]
MASPARRNKRLVQGMLDDEADAATGEAAPAKQPCPPRTIDSGDRSHTASPMKRSSLARSLRQESQTPEPQPPSQGTPDHGAAANEDQAKPRDAFWEELQKYESLLAEAATKPQQPANASSDGSVASGGEAGARRPEEAAEQERPSVASQTLPCLPVLTPYLDTLNPTAEMLDMERDAYEQSLGGSKSLFRCYWTARRGIVDASSHRQMTHMAEDASGAWTATTVDEHGRRLRDFDGQTPVAWLYQEQNLPVPAGITSMVKDGAALKGHRQQHGRSDHRHRGRGRGGGGGGGGRRGGRLE